MSKCLVCGDSDLCELVSYDEYPLCIGVIPQEIHHRIKAFPLSIGWCVACNHIQQLNRVAEKYKDILYRDEYADLLSTVPTPSMHDIGKSVAQECFDFFRRCDLPQGKVLDIGCHDGYFLSLVKQAGYDVQGCEPSPISEIAEKKYKIPIVREYYSRKYFTKHSFDIIILRNLFEHIEDLNGFIREVDWVLKPGGCLFIEVPNISIHLKGATLNCFFHQHLSYFTLDVLLYLLSKHSFEYVMSQEGYSLYLCVKKDIKVEKSTTLFQKRRSDRRNEIKLYFSEFKKRQKNLRKLLKEGENIAIFGAGGHTTGLLNMLGEDIVKNIKYVYDNSTIKQGNLLFAPPLKVKNPENLVTDKPDILVISTNLYQDDILNQVKKMNLSGTKIVAIYPQVGVIN